MTMSRLLRWLLIKVSTVISKVTSKVTNKVDYF